MRCVCVATRTPDHRDLITKDGLERFKTELLSQNSTHSKQFRERALGRRSTAPLPEPRHRQEAHGVGRALQAAPDQINR